MNGGQSQYGRVLMDADKHHAREWDQTNTLQRDISAARENMGEDRWAEINAEWLCSQIQDGSECSERPSCCDTHAQEWDDIHGQFGVGA